MLDILNKKISTWAGIITLLLIASFVGVLIIRQYQKVIEIRFETIELQVLEKSKEESP